MAAAHVDVDVDVRGSMRSYLSQHANNGGDCDGP